MNKILVICGPTSTGKTKLALKIAKIFKGEIVSADSRQVYEYMDIGTGKDIPSSCLKNRTKLGVYYLFNDIKVWGYDLAHPKEGFSVSGYVNKAIPIIKDIIKRGNLPILVGGTGLYIKGVIDGFETMDIPKNDDLRQKIGDKTVNELFEMLGSLDSIKAASMNASDVKNPVRLIRAVEIAMWKLDNEVFKNTERVSYDSLIIGLSLDTSKLIERITKRTMVMYREGIVAEIKKLLNKKGVTWSSQSLNTIGYREWREYLQKGRGDVDKIINDWIRKQISYAKRQMVWFKKDKRIVWFMADEKGIIENIEKKVRRWYTADNR